MKEEKFPPWNLNLCLLETIASVLPISYSDPIIPIIIFLPITVCLGKRKKERKKKERKKESTNKPTMKATSNEVRACLPLAKSLKR